MSQGDQTAPVGEAEVACNDPEPLTLGDYFRLLWPAKQGVFAVSLLCGVDTLLFTLTTPARCRACRATAVVKPDVSEQGRGAGVLGTLTSFGINVGGPTKVEDLEVLFRSAGSTPPW